MIINNPQIDPYLFERQFIAFKSFVEEQSGRLLVSFSNPYLYEQEDYKYKIHQAGRGALAFQTWQKSKIGTGDIIDAVIAAIETPGNNLVPWKSRFGDKARPHQQLYEVKGQQSQLVYVEESLFKLYHSEQDQESFAGLIDIFGQTYPLLAYLFFLKDRSKYLPIRPTYFDRAFKILGIDFRTSNRCSWENYSIYVALISELKGMLAESIGGEVTLLDAHSFAWILAGQMTQENRLANVQEYLNLSVTERETIAKARIGQGRFRQSLITYWSGCAVTGCAEVGLLRASHIKPWSKGTLEERLSLYNGLLLSPALDACFDLGYISFTDDGRILISKRLEADDVGTLGINSEMQLKRIEYQHREYLAYHREHIFN